MVRAVVLGSLLAAALLVIVTDASERQCYVCSSYMEQCKEKMDRNLDYVHKTKCKSSCFVRMGDDNALYRGCFDGFLEVQELKSLQGSTGCTNTTWNNRELPWCLCEGNLCNQASMYALGSAKKVVNKGYAKEGPAGDESSYDIHYDGHYEAPFEPEVVEKHQEYAPEYYQEQPQQGYEQEYQEEPKREYYEPEYNQVQDVNHADPYYTGYRDDEQGYDKLDDFVENNKQPEEQEPQAYDPYSQQRLPEQEHDAYQYPPYQNSPPYGEPENYYRDEQESRQGQVQEDYPPPAAAEYPADQEQQHYEEEQNYIQQEEPEPTQPAAFPQHLAARIQCAKTGFYQNPDDCRTFVACILDPHYRMPYMHLMRCPTGLVWDNSDKICMEYSTTCNIGGSALPSAAAAEEYEEPYEYVSEAETGEYHEPAAHVYEESYAAEESDQAYYPPQDRNGYYAEIEETEEQQPQAYYEPIDVDYQPK